MPTPIINVDTLAPLLESGSAAFLRAKIAPNVVVGALDIRAGQIICRPHIWLPVVDGMTCTRFLGQWREDRYPPILNDPGEPIGELRDTLFFAGTPNYYHFLVFELPTLFLMAMQKQGGAISLSTLNDVPATCKSFMAEFIPHFVGGREVITTRIPPGTYKASNVVFPIKSGSALAAFMNRQKILPFALMKSGIKDSLRELGAVKLFVRREGAGNGRNMLNQAEMEPYLTARGYVSVNPGELPMEEQVVLFSRATHIIGAEGAAMANIMFAPEGARVAVLANPLKRGETFFTDLAKAAGSSIHTIYGNIPSELRAAKASDFTVPVEDVAAFLDSSEAF